MFQMLHHAALTQVYIHVNDTTVFNDREKLLHVKPHKSNLVEYVISYYQYRKNLGVSFSKLKKIKCGHLLLGDIFQPPSMVCIVLIRVQLSTIQIL